MNCILVPVDFSKDSVNALDNAIRIANKTGAGVRVLHVRKSKNYDEPFVINGKDKEYGKTVEDFCQDLMDRFSFKYKAKGTFEYRIREGKIYKAIADQAKEDNADLIVMGTHGVSGFEEFWLGSNSYRVVCKAPCPVLTIRYGFHSKEVERIILPIDAPSETRKKVPYVAELAAAMGAEVHVIGVRSTNKADIVKRIHNYVIQTTDYLKKRNIKVVKKELYGGDVSEITMSYAVHNDAQLICIMSNHRGTPLNLNTSSSAQQMVNHSPVPIISIHPSYFK